MDINLFNYDFPADLIAQHPLEKRDASRLMVVDPKTCRWEHRKFHQFADYFGADDLIVMNDVKVFPSRLYGETEKGRRVEILLLEETKSTEWNCLVRPANKLRDGETVTFSEQLCAYLHGEGDRWRIEFNVGNAPLQDLIAAIGVPPLPPYIQRDDPVSAKPTDTERYQTIYAEKYGAAAAPTAGFHFTEDTLTELKKRGCEIAYVTLHVGRDTFQPVRSERIEDHVMHGETYEIPEQTIEAIQRAKQDGRRVTAIGTTTVRALESAFVNGDGSCRLRNPLAASKTDGPKYRSRHPSHSTNLFIYPGYQFQVVDRLLTNFHQPKSTLLMLISAFAGREFVLNAYQEAIHERYRLFSFGDAMLLLNRI